MPDILDRTPAPDIAVADAFAALPLEAPERSAWPQLAARLDAAQAARDAAAARRRPLRRLAWGLAIAATLAAVALVPGELSRPATPGTATPALATTAAAEARDLSALMEESARLEFLLQAVSTDADAASSGPAAALALEYEARVQQIDAALSDGGLAAADREALWRRRVDLLREYAGVQGTAQWLAAQGAGYDGDLVAVF